MAAMNFYKNFCDERILAKTLFIEMNEAACDAKKDLPQETEIAQPKDIPCIQIQTPGSNQGSVLSLVTRSIIDQSDEQPLTKIHACRYDECTKFHQKPNQKALESPASSLKNFCLFLLIGLLILWIIVYAVLVQFEVLK